MTTPTNDESTRRFPFSESFQFREDEKTTLEVLFENVFFDAPLGAEAHEAVERMRRRPDEAEASDDPATSTDADSSAPSEDSRHVVLLRGADGIGKTRVFRHLRERARDRRVSIYEIHNYDVEGIPLKPFLHAIRQIVGDATASGEESFGSVLLERYRYALEGLLPEAFGVEPTGRYAAHRLRERLASDKMRIFDGITQLLLEVSSRRPLLILVQDLHWADRATVELLGYIGRNIQLRNRAVLADGAGTNAAIGPTAIGGPELEGFGEDWRALPPPGVSLASAPVTGTWVAPMRSDDAAPGGSDPLSGPARRDRLPSRLMVFANYRGFEEEGHYIETAIERLGQESFAFHGELRPLCGDESGLFLTRAVEGVSVSGASLEMADDAAAAVHELSEGFPSFQQELFRGVFLDDPELATWSAQTFRDWLGAATSDDDESAAPPRFAVLRRRLRDVDVTERRVLQVLALARRPVSPEGIARVLARAEDEVASVPSDAEGAEGESAGTSPDSGEEAGRDELPSEDAAAALRCFDPTDGVEKAAETLKRLQAEGLIEAAEEIESASGGGTRRAGTRGSPRYRFRLWDFICVVEESVEPGIRRLIHQHIGELFRGVAADDTGSGAAADVVYEVYYHLSRGLEPESAVEFGLQAADRFERSFAFEKASVLYRELAELLSDDELLVQRLTILARLARALVATKGQAEAAEILRRIAQEGGAQLSPAERFELLLLEAEVARDASDPARALKVLGKAPKLLSDENTDEGGQLQIVLTQLRLDRQDWKRAINFGLKGVAIANKSGNKEQLGTMYQLIARAFYRKGDYAHAVDNYQRGLEVAEGLESRSLMVDILDELGRVYLERGNYFRAARYLYKALEERRRRYDVAGLCRSYDQLGLVYRRDGDYHKCIENLYRSLNLKERIGDFEALNPTLGTLGDLYFRLGDYRLAAEYFHREVANCRKLRDLQLDETGYLADSFCRQGFVHLAVGDLKTAESLAKQVLILASEFKLRSQEADGMLLEGNLAALRREWSPAEKSLKQAGEIHAKLGHRIREAGAILDLAETKFQRELYDETLKLASKAQIIADEVKVLDLRVRALTIKGNTYRFLKGGNPEKAKEVLGKALELSQNLNDVQVLFSLFYALAKVFHSEKEFSEAANYYSKAEAIQRRIGDRLHDNTRARYFDDARRKVFAEDVARFRKERQGRTAQQEAAEPHHTVDFRERPVSTENYKVLLERILRVNSAMNQLQFADCVLTEGLDLSGAERAVVLRVQNRQYQVVAARGFGKDHPDFPVATQVAEESIRRGKVIAKSGGDEPDTRLWESFSVLKGRSVLVVPLMTDERIFGALYLDKPGSVGRFTARDQSLLETFARHVGVSFQNRRQLDVAVREPLTGFYTPSYFIERLREEYRLFNLHDRSFSLVGFYLPVLEDAIGNASGGLNEKLAEELADVAPGAAICWGNPILYLLFRDVEPAVAEDYGARVVSRLEELLKEEVRHDVLAVERRYQQGSDMYFEIRRHLLPEECDHKTLTELRRLLARDITLKEAKRILEKHIIENTLRKTGGNITHAARELGIHRPQLSNYLKKYGLKRERFEREAEHGPVGPLENN